MRVSAAFLFAGLLYAQPAPPKAKALVEPKRLLNPTVYRDDACFRDCMAATALGGIDGRKRLLEAVAVGCQTTYQGVYVLAQSRVDTFTIQGKKVVFAYVALNRDGSASAL